MRVYFLRHATAVDRLPDEERELSSEGVSEAQKLHRFLRGCGLQFSAAYSSPYVRARQTAEIVLGRSLLVPGRSLELVEVMTNECPDEEFQDWMRGLPAMEDLLLVGHLPSIESRIGLMLSPHGIPSVRMGKGSLACVETDGLGWGRLLFHVSPKYLLV